MTTGNHKEEQRYRRDPDEGPLYGSRMPSLCRTGIAVVIATGVAFGFYKAMIAPRPEQPHGAAIRADERPVGSLDELKDSDLTKR